MSETDDATQRILKGLESGKLRQKDLTARNLGAFLGRTTGHLYHHFGSLDGLLYSVAEAGYAQLSARLGEVFAREGCLADVAEAYVEFGLARPALYRLMFEHPFDWKALRARGAFQSATPKVALWRALLVGLMARGVLDPEQSARLLIAGLHGQVSLALSGRANFNALEQTDREVAVRSARALADLIFSTNGKDRPDDHLHRSAPETPPADPAKPPGQSRSHREPGKPRRRAE